MAFRADRKNPKASMMATFGHFSDSRQRVADQVRHELMGFGDPHSSVPWGDELIAIAEELTTAYGDEYGPLDYRTAARTLFLRLFLAHFARFFAVFSLFSPS